MVSVFAYGTLKPGEANYAPYCGGRVDCILEARMRGRLFDLSLGYPAAVAEWGDRGWVSGYVLQFGERDILARFDALEDYWPGRAPQFNEYQRRFVPVRSPLGKPLGFAWAYFMLPERVRAHSGRLLPAGVWRSLSSG